MTAPLARIQGPPVGRMAKSEQLATHDPAATALLHDKSDSPITARIRSTFLSSDNSIASSGLPRTFTDGLPQATRVAPLAVRVDIWLPDEEPFALPGLVAGPYQGARPR